MVIIIFIYTTYTYLFIYKNLNKSFFYYLNYFHNMNQKCYLNLTKLQYLEVMYQNKWDKSEVHSSKEAFHIYHLLSIVVLVNKPLSIVGIPF